VVPEGPNGLEPLLALVQPEMMLAALYQVRESQKRSIFAVLDSMAVKKISRGMIQRLEIADSCFLNVNLPEDLDLARELSKR
jgi:molybdopterin-guanine dinucleotide biosynthesis protein A